jgi:hypothetical protein
MTKLFAVWGYNDDNEEWEPVRNCDTRAEAEKLRAELIEDGEYERVRINAG